MFKLEKLLEVSTKQLNRDLLKQFIISYRGCEEEETAINLSNYLSERGCIFVYSKDFLSKVYGRDFDILVKEILQNDRIVDKCILIPLIDVKRYVLGFTINYFCRSPKYKDPEEYTVKKSRLLRFDSDIINKVEKENYLIVCEGVYDELFTASLEIPITGVGGTSIPKEMNTILTNLAEVIVVCGDNDLSGKKLWENIKMKTGKKVSLKIGCNDLGEFLLKEENQLQLKKTLDREKLRGFPNQLIKV